MRLRLVSIRVLVRKVMAEEDVKVVKELKGRDGAHLRSTVPVREIFTKSFTSKVSFQGI